MWCKFTITRKVSEGVNNSITWKIKEVVPYIYEDEYKRHVWEGMKRKVGNELYSILERQKNPAVVELLEHVPVVYEDSYGIVEKVEIEVIVTPVESREITIHRTPYNDLGFVSKPNFWKRIKFAFTGKIK